MAILTSCRYRRPEWQYSLLVDIDDQNGNDEKKTPTDDRQQNDGDHVHLLVRGLLHLTTDRVGHDDDDRGVLAVWLAVVPDNEEEFVASLRQGRGFPGESDLSGSVY